MFRNEFRRNFRGQDCSLEVKTIGDKNSTARWISVESVKTRNGPAQNTTTWIKSGGNVNLR